MSNSDVGGSVSIRDPRQAGIVVVGASHAAVAMADRLRGGGHRGQLRLIGCEPHLPYQRPPLSKTFLKGGVDAESLALRESEYFRSHSIDLVSGERVVGIDCDSTGAGVVHTRREGHRNGEELGSSYAFDRLVLATGARPRRLAIPGADHPDVVVLRDLDDSKRLAARVELGPVVVIGGGFIGLEVAATVRSLGGDVTVIEAGTQLMGRAVGSETAAYLGAAHASMGVEILLRSRPAEIMTAGNKICGVQLEDGRTLPAATVLVGIGVEPRDELARSLGLDCAETGGVVVDEDCRTSDGVTLAIGDCTVQPRPGAADGGLIRLESVDNADEQAARAASTLLATEPTPRSVPWFWSDQGPWKLQIAGLIDNRDDCWVRSDPARLTRRSVLYFRDDVLVAVECVNAPADFLMLRKSLSRGELLSQDALVDNSISLRELLAAARH